MIPKKISIIQSSVNQDPTFKTYNNQVNSVIYRENQSKTKTQKKQFYMNLNTRARAMLIMERK